MRPVFKTVIWFSIVCLGACSRTSQRVEPVQLRPGFIVLRDVRLYSEAIGGHAGALVSKDTPVELTWERPPESKRVFVRAATVGTGWIDKRCVWEVGGKPRGPARDELTHEVLRTDAWRDDDPYDGRDVVTAAALALRVGMWVKVTDSDDVRGVARVHTEHGRTGTIPLDDLRPIPPP